MKKLIGIAVIFALLSFVGSAYGAVGINNDHDDSETYVGEASNICIEGQDVSFDGSQVTILANGHKDGVTTNVSTESNLTSAALNYGVIKLVAGSAKYISLAAGTPGQMLSIIMTTYDAGSITITDDYVSSTAQAAVVTTGWDDIVFNSTLDMVTLLYVDDTIGWIVIGYYGVVIT